jgi:dethiobiotin synthetase
MTPLLIVTGTGTEIGKTAVSEALVHAWGQTHRIAGLKPIESGVVANDPGDVNRLGRVSTFHVTRFTSPYLLEAPVSPHLAARREGRLIDLTTIRTWVDSIRTEADGVLVELPGGLFSPITDTLTNADLAKALAATNLLLIAPDRLGVLHDVIATVHAAHSAGISFDGIILSAPAEPDASTGTNAAELRRFVSPPILASLPRASTEDLSRSLQGVLDTLHLR